MGHVAELQTAGGVIFFFRDHQGKPIVSPALFEPIGEKFRKDIKDRAQANVVPIIRFGAGERKADVMAPYWTLLQARAVRRWLRSAVPRSSSWCGRRASGTPIRAGARN